MQHFSVALSLRRRRRRRLCIPQCQLTHTCLNVSVLCCCSIIMVDFRANVRNIIINHTGSKYILCETASYLAAAPSTVHLNSPSI